MAKTMPKHPAIWPRVLGINDRIWATHQPIPVIIPKSLMVSNLGFVRASVSMEFDKLMTMKKSSIKLKGIKNINHADLGDIFRFCGFINSKQV